jgi:hypothetical protein
MNLTKSGSKHPRAEVSQWLRDKGKTLSKDRTPARRAAANSSNRMIQTGPASRAAALHSLTRENQAAANLDRTRESLSALKVLGVVKGMSSLIPFLCLDVDHV